MNDTLASAVVGLLCIAAIGVSATTLDSSVASEPDDVLDHDQIPVSEGQAAQFEREFRSNAAGGGPGDDESETAHKRSGTGEQRQAEQSGAGQQQQSQQQNEQESQSSQSQNQQNQRQNGGLDVRQQTWFERLLAFLERWWPVLVAAALLAGAAYRYRDRLAALAAALAPRSGTDGDDGPDRPWADADPADEVARAWLSLARRTDVDSPRARTTAEYADAAVEQGLDPDAVETVTREFEAVRYRGADVTDDRARRATESRERFDRGGRPATDGAGDGYAGDGTGGDYAGDDPANDAGREDDR